MPKDDADIVWEVATRNISELITLLESFGGRPPG